VVVGEEDWEVEEEGVGVGLDRGRDRHPGLQVLHHVVVCRVGCIQAPHETGLKYAKGKNYKINII
jgi:hypothetical protein